MVFSKNFLLVLLVLSTITLCLAKPRWVWLDEKDDEKDDGDWNDEVLTRGKNDEDLLKKWKKSFAVCYGSNQLPGCIKKENN